jgi:hypothetical protein
VVIGVDIIKVSVKEGSFDCFYATSEERVAMVIEPEISAKGRNFDWNGRAKSETIP